MHSRIPEADATFRNYVAPLMDEGKMDELEAEHEKQARESLAKRLEAFAKTELEAFPEDYKNITDIEVVHGHTVPEILHFADRIDADVIVMGTHGKGAITHTFLGSVAEKVLHRSKRPVFVIPIPD